MVSRPTPGGHGAVACSHPTRVRPGHTFDAKHANPIALNHGMPLKAG